MTHFPKSAGTSLRASLESELQERILVDYRHDPLGPNADCVVRALPADIIGVYGHFNPKVYAIFPSFRATFLREPVSNLISIYYFWRAAPSHGNPIHDKFLAEMPSVIEFSKYPKIQTLMSETYFGGVDIDRFDFIGFYEYYEADYRLFFEKIGVSAIDPERINVTEASSDREQTASDRRLCEALRASLDKDVRFYSRLMEQRFRHGPEIG